MKVAQIQKFGGPEVIELVDIEKPKPGKGQVLVKVYASSVNPFDYKLRNGAMKINFPFTMGLDVAGVVTEVGEGVENVSVGNKVYGSAASLAGATGGFAEFAVVPTGIIAKIPNNIDFNQAAAVVLTGCSAVQALLEHLELKSGQKVLIHGGAGGIGTMAIQIAKSLGAYVATTVTGDGIEYVKKLGADEVIDYQNQQFQEIIKEYDGVYDTVGGEVFEKSFEVLKKHGVLVSMVAHDEKKLAEKYGVKVISQFTKVTTERLNILAQYIENGAIKVHIDKIYPFDNIREAFVEQEGCHVLGKIVISINH